jgi:hypothetical protein
MRSNPTGQRPVIKSFSWMMFVLKNTDSILKSKKNASEEA